MHRTASKRTVRSVARCCTASGVKVVSKLSKPIRESRRADSNRLTLLQLRVIHQALQGYAEACKSRISKGFSLLRLALRCTALRSRWCQGGVNIVLAVAPYSSVLL